MFQTICHAIPISGFFIVLFPVADIPHFIGSIRATTFSSSQAVFQILLIPRIRKIKHAGMRQHLRVAPLGFRNSFVCGKFEVFSCYRWICSLIVLSKNDPCLRKSGHQLFQICISFFPHRFIHQCKINRPESVHIVLKARLLLRRRCLDRCASIDLSCQLCFSNIRDHCTDHFI